MADSSWQGFYSWLSSPANKNLTGDTVYGGDLIQQPNVIEAFYRNEKGETLTSQQKANISTLLSTSTSTRLFELQQAMKIYDNTSSAPINPTITPPIGPPDVGTFLSAPTLADLPSGKGHGIFCFVNIGGVIVANGLSTSEINDVIKMNADFNTDIEGGSPTATCKIVVHNNRQKYGHMVANGTWKLNLTTARVIVWNFKNMVAGTDTYIERHEYMFFYGVLQRITFDSATCTFELASFDGDLQQAHFTEETFDLDKTTKEKVEAIITVPLMNNGFFPFVLDATVTNPYIAAGIANAKQSTLLALSELSNRFGFYTYFDAAHYGDYPRVLMINDLYVDNFAMNLDPYVTKQGYAMSADGHANVIDEGVNSPVDPLETWRSVPGSINEVNHLTFTNAESIAKYGRILNLEGTDGDTAGGIDNALKRAKNIALKLDAKIDNKIEATVLGIVPQMFTFVIYTISDGTATGENNITIVAKVTKKSVEYSSSGLLTHLTMRRWQVSDTQPVTLATGVPVPPVEEKFVPVLIISNAKGNAWTREDGNYDVATLEGDYGLQNTELNVNYPGVNANDVFTLLGARP